MASKIFRPRRGRKLTAISKGIVLRKGEIYFEVPDSGVGTGACKVKMGDGVTPYERLPYAIDGGIEEVGAGTIVFDQEEFPDNVTTEDLFTEITSGSTMSRVVAAMRLILVQLSKKVTELNDNLGGIGDGGSTSTSNVEELFKTKYDLFNKTTTISKVDGNNKSVIESDDAVTTNITTKDESTGTTTITTTVVPKKGIYKYVKTTVINNTDNEGKLITENIVKEEK